MNRVDHDACASLAGRLRALRLEEDGSPTEAIVIAVDATRGVFAVETRTGQCAVFCQHAGPEVQAGDLLKGAVISRGARALMHMDGPCAAVGDSGPVTREEALARVRQHGTPF